MGDVADEMVDILLLLCLLVLLEDERLWPAETVMDLPYFIGVGQDKPSVLAGKGLGKLVVLFQWTCDLHIGIEQDRQDSLGRTCIIDNLSGKEEILIVHSKRLARFDALGPLEQENEAIDFRLELGDELVVVDAVQFLDLHGRHSKFADQLREYPGIGLDGAPIVEHDISISSLIYKLSSNPKGKEIIDIDNNEY